MHFPEAVAESAHCPQRSDPHQGYPFRWLEGCLSVLGVTDNLPRKLQLNRSQHRKTHFEFVRFNLTPQVLFSLRTRTHLDHSNDLQNFRCLHLIFELSSGALNDNWNQVRLRRSCWRPRVEPWCLDLILTSYLRQVKQIWKQHFCRLTFDIWGDLLLVSWAILDFADWLWVFFHWWWAR